MNYGHESVAPFYGLPCSSVANQCEVGRDRARDQSPLELM